MRGAFINLTLEVPNQRITPAHAGSIFSLGSQHTHLGDHPRACGEHRLTFRANRHLLGSPPRMRGAYEAILKRLQELRITPAHAGSM